MTRARERTAGPPVVRRRGLRCLVVAAAIVIGMAIQATAQDASQPAAGSKGPTLDVYGFGQADAIGDFKQNDPAWFDVLRPTKLPNAPKQFGEDGHFYLSARQSRFGAKGTLPTPRGDVNAVFEFDLFGVGADAGLTTIRLRHAWGQFKQIGGGQTNSQFMDVDVFPNILDYWGPNGMLFFRNVQVFWEPYRQGPSNLRIAIEQPGASADQGLVAQRIELQNVRARFPAPDLTGHYRFGRERGYIQLGAALRYLAWDDLLPNDAFDLSGHAWGWGVAGSSSLKVTAMDTLRLMLVYGHGIQNYFNDAPVDVGVKSNLPNLVTPVTGEALPVLGAMVYLDHNWNDRFSTAVGYARVDIDNSDLQAPNAFHIGQYGSANLLATPAKNVLIGAEFQWARRENNSDGFTVNDYRIQFSTKFSFTHTFRGGQP